MEYTLTKQDICAAVNQSRENFTPAKREDALGFEFGGLLSTEKFGLCGVIRETVINCDDTVAIHIILNCHGGHLWIRFYPDNSFSIRAGDSGYVVKGLHYTDKRNVTKRLIDMGYTLHV